MFLKNTLQRNEDFFKFAILIKLDALILVPITNSLTFMAKFSFNLKMEKNYQVTIFTK